MKGEERTRKERRDEEERRCDGIILAVIYGN